MINNLHLYLQLLCISLVVFSLIQKFFTSKKIGLSKLQKSEIQKIALEINPLVKIKIIKLRGGQTATFLTYPVKNNLELTVVLRNKLDQFLSSLNLTQELQTGDPEFDSKFLIMSLGRKDTETLLRSTNFIELVKVVGNHTGFLSISCLKREISIRGNSSFSGPNPETELQESIHVLTQISSLFEANNTGPLTFRGNLVDLQLYPFPGALSIIIGIIWSSAEFSHGAPMVLHQLASYDSTIFRPFYFPISLVLTAILVFVVFLRYRYLGRDGTGLHRSYFLGLISSSIAFFYLSFALILFVNRTFSDQTESKNILEVSNKLVEYRKHNKYYIIARRTNPNSEWSKFSISHFDYAQFQLDKSQFEIVTRPGFLGYEWFAGYSIKNRP